MGQTLSNGISTLVSRVEYDSVIDRCRGMEQLNKELKIVVTERDVEIEQKNARINLLNNEILEKNICMSDLEKQTKHNASRYSLAENHVNDLINNKNDLLAKISDQDEKINELSTENIELDGLVKKIEKQLTETKKDDSLQEAEIEKLQNKNSQLRSKATKLQEELTLYKKNISLINNLVDQVQDCDDNYNFEE